jgi:hypothetical protein
MATTPLAIFYVLSAINKNKKSYRAKSSFWPTPGHFKWGSGWPPLLFTSDPRAVLGLLARAQSSLFVPAIDV